MSIVQVSLVHETFSFLWQPEEEVLQHVLSQTNRGSQCPVTPPILQLIGDVLQVDPDSVTFNPRSFDTVQKTVLGTRKNPLSAPFCLSTLSNNLI